MKMRPEIISQLRKLVPPEMQSKAYIAGGYAHNPDKADDIDVWIVGQEDMAYAQDQIRIFNGHDIMAPKTGLSLILEDFEYNEHPHGFMVAVNTFVSEQFLMMKTQILVTRQPDIKSLLEHFDITTHKIAYSLAEPETFYVGEGYFPIGAGPRVTRFDTPEQTLVRLEKLCDRYGFKPHPEDVAALELLTNREAA